MTLENLTDCEQLVMKTVWDAEEELSLMEVMQRVNDKYHINFSGASGEERVSETLPPRSSSLLSDFDSP